MGNTLVDLTVGCGEGFLRALLGLPHFVVWSKIFKFYFEAYDALTVDVRFYPDFEEQ
jgi:hypothetical protein